MAEPLGRGGDHCAFHARPFCTRPAEDFMGKAIVSLFTLETTGLDVTRDLVVEIAAYEERAATAQSDVEPVPLGLLSGGGAFESFRSSRALRSRSAFRCRRRPGLRLALRLLRRRLLLARLVALGQQSPRRRPPLPWRVGGCRLRKHGGLWVVCGAFTSARDRR